jgi:hypothetical protein
VMVHLGYEGTNGMEVEPGLCEMRLGRGGDERHGMGMGLSKEWNGACTVQKRRRYRRRKRPSERRENGTLAREREKERERERRRRKQEKRGKRTNR